MDKNLKTEIEKNKGPPKEKDKDKEKTKEITKDITELKNYRIPDANNKKYFDKINNYNFIGIIKYIYFPEVTELTFVNKKFYNLINQRYPKKIPLIKTSIKTLKKNIFLNFSQDFFLQFQKNCSFISGTIKNMIETQSIEYFPKMQVKKYYFTKMKSNPDIKKLYLSNCDIGKKSMKYLSYYFYNKNCNITDIDISGNKITAETLSPITKNPKIILNSLIVNKCIIDLKTFTNLSNINTKKLSLVNNNLDNELISKLENPYINELNLSHNSISNDGLFSICNNLPNLQKLNLANNNICDFSIVYICLYIKKQKQNKLISLNLKDNKITITGMITLVSTFEKINKVNKDYSLSKLNLSGNLLDLVPIPKRLGNHFLNVKIEKLCLGNHSFNINDLNILLNFINNIQNIKVLDLSKIVFDNVSLNLIFNRVSENLSLKKLKLKNCYLGNTEVNNTLENYYTKKYEHKENNKKNNKNKNKNNSKKDIIDDNDDIINEKEEIIINNDNNDTFHEKEEIIINNDKNDTCHEKEEIIINNDNEMNNINNTNLIKNNEENSDNIIDKKEKNNINDNNINEINENIININNINDIEKSDSNKSNKYSINEYISVKSLDLGYNFINYQKLDKILLSNHIKELNIEGNDLHLWGNDIYLFFDFIINNKVLEKLNLNNNNLQKMVNTLLEKINNFNIKNNSNCSLKYLSLEDNQIKDIYLELNNLLSNNKNLEVLNLKHNLIGDEIANNYFFHSLFNSEYSNLNTIDISNNKISLNFLDKIIKYSQENTIKKININLNITSKEIREAYLNIKNKESYKELVKFKNLKCL